MSACKLSVPFSVLQKMAPIVSKPTKSCGCRCPFNLPVDENVVWSKGGPKLLVSVKPDAICQR